MKIPSRALLPSATLFGAFALIGGTGLTVSSAWLITSASKHPPIMVLGVSIVMVRFFGISRSASRYLERVISHEAIFGKLTGLRVALFEKISTQLRTLNVSQSVKRIVDDVERAQEFYLRVTLPQYAAAISATTTIALAWWVNYRLLFWILPATLIFALLIPLLTRVWVDPVTVEIENRENNYSESITMASHGVVEAEHFGYGHFYRATLKKESEELCLLERKYFFRISILQLILTFTLGATLVGIANSMESARTYLPVHISMAIFLTLVGFEGYTTWFPNLFIAGKSRRASRNISTLIKGVELETQEERIEPRDFVLVAREFSPHWGKEFLTPINFTLSSGETLVVSGASGVGKSTLASALFGFSQYSGELKIGGIEIGNLTEGLISGTLQQSHIFSTSLRENLKIANPSASDVDLQKVITMMELESIDLDEVLGEYGRSLSGGEAKRLATARALLSPARLLILDEPLEHLDYELSLRIQSAISAACADRTLIVITHTPWLQYSRKLDLTRE
jgi:ATP-binding cassette subfamily C protein CydC